MTTGSVRYLCVFFSATAGKQGDDLGSDESQIILIVTLIYDILNNKTVAVQHYLVKPSSQEHTDNVLSEECKLETDISEDAVKNSLQLEQVLDEIERFLKTKGIHPELGGEPMSMVADGPSHLRLCLHAEAMRKSIRLKPYMSYYFDLRKEFQKLYKSPTPSILDMLQYLSIEGDQSIDYGVRQAHDMANIIKRLLNDGHQFSDGEKINDRLQPGICSKTDYVDDDTVVRARGLPWQASDSDIAKFFTGLNIAKGGVALCLSQQGRRNGEALIRFDSKESRDLALKKHKHHLGNRYIEVYRASGKDFLNVAGGTNTEAQAFLSQGAQCIIRMRGLPYTATAEQVLKFFAEGDRCVHVHNGRDGIMFVQQVDGRATGDAFVLFASEEDAVVALSKHKELIGSRYIELFKSTTAEVQQVLNRTAEPPMQARGTPPHDPNSMGGLGGIPPMNQPFLPLPQAPLLPSLSSPYSPRDCIRLRGLPFEANVTDILGFLGEHSRSIVFQGVHMVYNAAGTPSGEAFIQMDSEMAAESAAINRHKKFMLLSGPGGVKKRYIEVFQCSSNDMSIILSNTDMSNLPTATGPAPNLNQLQSPLALTPPGLAMQMSPSSQGSPPSQVAAVAAAGQLSNSQLSAASQFCATGQLSATQLQALQQFLPRTPLLTPTSIATSAGMMAGLGAYSNSLSNPLSIPGALSQPMISQLAHQQFLLSQQAAAAGNLSGQGGPRQVVPGLYGHSPILYYYPSPPVSPQTAYFNANPAAAANATGET